MRFSPSSDWWTLATPCHVRVTCSPEHYQPLCRYARCEHTYVCRHAYTCVYAFICGCMRLCVYMYVCVYVWGRRLHGYIREYIRPIHKHRDVYTGWGSVRETAVGFRYDTVDRTARIFGIEALSLGKISVHHRMPEKYFDTVYRCLHALMHVCTGTYTRSVSEIALQRLSIEQRKNLMRNSYACTYFGVFRYRINIF